MTLHIGDAIPPPVSRGAVTSGLLRNRTVQVDRLDRTVMRKKGRKWQGEAPPAVDTHAPL